MKFKWASDTFVCPGRRSEAGGEFAGQEAQQPTAHSDISMGTHQPQNWQQQEQQQHHGTHERDREHEQQHHTMVSLPHPFPISPGGCVDPAGVTQTVASPELRDPILCT
jgi:hypothetical protein